MENTSTKSRFNLGLFIGILGMISGVILVFISENWLIEVSGFFASAGLAYHSYKENQASKKTE